MSIPTINVVELAELMQSTRDLQLIDVRESDEREICHIGGLHIPLSTLPDHLSQLSRDKPIVVYCRSGGRSMQACHFLLQAGYRDVKNLTGGILQWIEEIDPTLTRY